MVDADLEAERLKLEGTGTKVSGHLLDSRELVLSVNFWMSKKGCGHWRGWFSWVFFE